MPITRIAPLWKAADPEPMVAGGCAYGGLVFTSQIPRKEDGTVELGSLLKQAHQVIGNLCATLEALGSGADRLLHITVYLTNIESYLDEFNHVYEDLLPTPHCARCAVGVDALAIPNLKVELTAIAAGTAI